MWQNSHSILTLANIDSSTNCGEKIGGHRIKRGLEATQGVRISGETIRTQHRDAVPYGKHWYRSPCP